MANQEEPLHTHTAQQLKNDAIKKILMRVPATSLLRYQLVCKNWWAIMQEPQFKKDHFKLNNATNGPLRLLVVKGRLRTTIFCENSIPVDVESQRRKIWMPRVLGNDGHFAGSCNGLLCTEAKGEITVFNPITREVVYLPKPTYITGYGSNENENEKMYTDFFFHSATNEYKVMLFHQEHPSMLCSVNMYTLGANSSWRQVEKISDIPSNSGVNVEDTIYWPYFSEAIISFDLREEKVNFLRPPIEYAKLVGVTKWHGELCGVSFEREDGNGIQYGRIKIWTRDAGGVWNMRYEVDLQANGSVWLLAPFSIIMNRVFFVISKSTLICCDMSRNGGNIGMKYGYLDSTCQIKNCFAYVESLLPVPK
ncbi:putative F-box protein At3g17480 [Carex rostrata]